jgi:dihydroorotate dehydrogenase
LYQRIVFEGLSVSLHFVRYGFNSDGHEAVYKRLQLLKSKPSFVGIVGVNLGKNKNSEDPVRDYVIGIKKFGDVADYLVINISR